MEKHKKLIMSAAVAVFVILSALIFVYIGKPMLALVSQPGEFRSWVDEHGFLGQLAYIGMTFLQVFIAIIPGEPLEIGGGYAFGAIEGTILCVIGCALGSIAVFMFVRKFGIKLVEVFYPADKLKSIKFLQTSKKKEILYWVVFLIPGTPKDLLCYFAGLTDIKLSAWICICSLGRLPSIITSTIGGNALSKGDYLYAVIVFIISIIVSGTGLLLYRLICKRHEKKRAE